MVNNESKNSTFAKLPLLIHLNYKAEAVLKIRIVKIYVFEHI